MTVSRRAWLRTVLQAIGIGLVVGPGLPTVDAAHGSEVAREPDR